MYNGWTALTRAVYWGRTDVAMEIVNSGRGVDLDTESQSWTALQWALARRHLDIAHMLIAQPSVDVDWKDADGFTPFITATNYNHCDIVRALLQDRQGLDANAKYGSGVTALGWAVQFNFSRYTQSPTPPSWG
ncbi:hypothetical protein ASPCAL06801 [Aspergillus calidoustus]|uniref:Uncharacterized protein n=1 Tax=Aspergillus calidoustus TaxID=454130 RepID=A0A0U5GX57_ASPCI|nr:hypothetical protein ASPCAL06801 [Aspergillus calidoustus]